MPPRANFYVTVSRMACALAGTLAGLLVLLVTVSRRSITLDLTRVILVSVLWGVIAWGVFRLAVWIAQGIKKSSDE
jgi:hypothetical protein